MLGLKLNHVSKRGQCWQFLPLMLVSLQHHKEPYGGWKTDFFQFQTVYEAYGNYMLTVHGTHKTGFTAPITWINPICSWYSALPIYRGLFSPNNSRETSMARPLGRGKDVFLEDRILADVHLWIQCTVCGIVLYGTAIYRESIVVWQNKGRSKHCPRWSIDYFIDNVLLPTDESAVRSRRALPLCVLVELIYKSTGSGVILSDHIHSCCAMMWYIFMCGYIYVCKYAYTYTTTYTFLSYLWKKSWRSNVDIANHQYVRKIFENF